MLISLDVAKLYEHVLKKDMLLYNISPEAVKFGIDCMAHVYKGEKFNLAAERSQVADYSDPAHRCAYLHKYAALHTSMVRDMLYRAIQQNFNTFHNLVFSGDRFRLCSLGGGPGTDVIGALAALHLTFSYFDSSVTVVDYMAEWSQSFSSILNELGSGWYGAFGNNMGYFLNWQYIGANLLKNFKPEVMGALSSAHLVTMIKFTSAAACKDTYSMIKNIFTCMKPGAMLLFIDNAGGGFHKLIVDASVEFGFRSIFGPLEHEQYTNDFCRERRFNTFSCFKTTVTVHILQKPFFDSAFMMNPYHHSSFTNDYPYLLENRRLVLGENVVPTRPFLLRSPPTPFLYLGKSPGFATPMQEIPEHPRRNSLLPSPVEELPRSSPRNALLPSRIATPLTTNFINSPPSVLIERPTIYTPDTLRRGGKRARVQGCFGMKIHNFRHHVSKKVAKVKARARTLFKSRKENIHRRL